ncbi:response regulator transcription factor [Agathobaculum massiliense]|uniref:response regulator transcription factor n=1 Tax=Agathobaculum massiliense TaxID=3014267 RepID=UPI000D1DE697|nr:response regulator transcription factor [Agathobaculum massiliense]
MRILVVEDERELAESIAEGLRMDGYSVDMCGDGNEAAERAVTDAYDLLLLDLNLPGKDGLQVLKEVRLERPELKTLLLTARSSVADRVLGLDSGADDYLTKPFSFDELEARIRVLLRRRYIQSDVRPVCGPLEFDTLSRMVQVYGKPLALTRKETSLLEYLMLHAGQLVTPEELLEHVWDGSVDEFSNSVRVHISSLRRKLRAALEYDPIMNRVGEGYILSVEVK